MIITFVYADNKHELNTSIFRCVTPVDAINKSKDHEAYLVNIRDFAQSTIISNICCNKSQVIVIERNIFKEVHDAINYWKSQGKLVLANFDDAYQFMTPSNISYSFWVENKGFTTDEKGNKIYFDLNTNIMEDFKNGLKLCHGIVTPSKVLSDDWSYLNKTYVLPNYFKVDDYYGIPPIRPHEGIIIGWGGSMSHFQSWKDSGIIDAIRKVVNANTNVRLMICGNKDVFDSIPLDNNKKIFQPYVSPLEWPIVQKTFDIGLAPLHGLYDQRRSYIKVVEYMLLQIPFIASESLSYEELYHLGTFVPNQRKKWVDALEYMINNLDAEREKAKDIPYKFALTTNYEDNVDIMINLFFKIGDENGINLRS